jgi:hypothetical protein
MLLDLEDRLAEKTAVCVPAQAAERPSKNRTTGCSQFYLTAAVWDHDNAVQLLHTYNTATLPTDALSYRTCFFTGRAW